MLLNQKPYEDFKKAESGDECSSGIEIVMMRGTSSKSHKKRASEKSGIMSWEHIKNGQVHALIG
jgi:hypothetical protein